jgi:hypothetical protein
MRRFPVALLALLLVTSSATACKSRLAGAPTADPTVPIGLAPAVSGERLLAAKMLTDNQIAGLGGRHEEGPFSLVITETTKFTLVTTCSPRLPLDDRVRTAVRAMWSSRSPETLSVRQTLARYDDVAGAAAVAEAERALACGSHNTRYGPVKIGDVVPLPPAPGIDRQYAFCDEPTLAPLSCYLLMAKDIYATTVVVSSQDVLAKIAPLVAASLGKA